MRLLVVEDNAVTAQALCELLGDRGHHCDWAADGESALVRMGARAYDALIVDVYVPGLDGVALARRARAQQAWRSVPIVLVTAARGTALAEMRADLAELAPAVLVEKPYEVGQIEAALASLSGEESSI